MYAFVFSPLFFDSFTSSEKHLLLKKGLHVVKSQWLEDCLERDQRLQEGPYSLKTTGVQDLEIVEWSVTISFYIFRVMLEPAYFRYGILGIDLP